MSSIFDNFKSRLHSISKTIRGSDNNAIKKIVENEITAWQGKKETDSSVQDRLAAYWDNIGVDSWTAAGTPWSGAFISYVLKNDSSFTGSGLHAEYVEDVIDGVYPGWTAYNVPINTYGEHYIEVNVGDVFVKSRLGGYKAGHGDIVYRVDTQEGKAYLIGGNMGGSQSGQQGLRVTTLELRDGINRYRGNDYDIVLKREKKSIGWVGLVAVGGLAWMLLN